MSKVALHTVWGWWKGAEGPSLLIAWDDYDVEENFDGWQEAKKERIAACDLIEDIGVREFVISVPYEGIEASFYPAEIEDDVEVEPR